MWSIPGMIKVLADEDNSHVRLPACLAPVHESPQAGSDMFPCRTAMAILREEPPPRCAAPAGFTLVELITVVAVLAILSAMAIPVYSDYTSKARITRTVAEIRQIATSVTAYYSDHDGRYPDTLGDVGLAGLSDPWGHPYQYLKIEGGDSKGKSEFRKDRFLNPLNTDYDLYSMGPDGLSQKPLNAKESRDDILRANNGGFIGPASEF
jgi:general secretion pathway protein G